MDLLARWGPPLAGVGWDGTALSLEGGGSPVGATPGRGSFPTHPPFDEGTHRAEKQ